MGVVLWIGLVASLLYWLGMAVGALRLSVSVPPLADVQVGDRNEWPRLSVVVAARNEADRMEWAARGLLAQSYPALSVVLVNDRSNDGTGALIDRLAAEDPRVRAVHIDALPDRWMGKVHAMSRGLEASDGELVLFTDADVHFEPDALLRAVAHVEDEQVGHLAVFPELRPSGVVVDSLIIAYVRQLLTLLTPPARAVDPKSKSFFGAGAFNLVRRRALDASPGLEWLRLEPADDMGLGLLMKEAGAKAGVLGGQGLVHLQWYRSFGEWLRGSEKSWAVTTGCWTAPLLVSIPVFTALEMAPLIGVVAALVSGWGLFAALSVLPLVFHVLASAALVRWMPCTLGRALMGPVLAPVAAWAGFRSVWRGTRAGGVMWRDTFYPAAMIRSGRRIPPRPPV